MSRIGKKPILVPAGVEVKIGRQRIEAKGPHGELAINIRPEIKIELKDGSVIVSPAIATKKTAAFWGLTRQLINNILQGVAHGFEKQLEIKGTGYKVFMEDETLIVEAGYSHSVKILPVSGIKISTKRNIISVFGADKEKVGNVAAKIRRVRKVEPYKGKGIRYVGEVVRRKAGKKAATAK